MIGALLGDFWPYIAGALAIVAVYFKGNRDAKKRQQVKELRQADETRTKMDGVDTSGNDDEWLRNRAKRP
jgi:hypothetical protein